MKSLSLVTALLLAGGSVLVAPALIAQERPAPVSEKPWADKTLTPDRRAELLLAAMTLEEKVALLHGPMAIPFGPQRPMPKGAVGSAGYIAGNERLGIPALQESDASLGVTNPGLVRGAADMSTALPASLLLAATFDPEIARAGGVLVGTEARAKGMNVQLAGGANLLRDPRGGRNFEYAGEDPLLAGTIAGAAIRGIQSTGMVSTMKHFSINGQEHKRMTADSVIGEANHRESDLLAFQIALEAGDPGSVMCAYNLVNGVYACENDPLLNRTLKRDWGYKGWVMSDWGAVHSLGALTAGLDQQSGEQLDKQVFFDKPLKDAVAAGSIPEARVTDAARRILRAMFANGLFDTPPAKAEIDFPAHARIVQNQAEQGIVLLKNDSGVLPLARGAKKIAVIGQHVEAGVPSGSGSSQVTNPWRASPMTQVRSVPIGGEGMMASWSNVVFHPSSPLAAIRARFRSPGAADASPFAGPAPSPVVFNNGIYPESAAADAKGADVAIVFVYQPSGEGDDVPNLTLPFGQDALVEAVAAANPNTIVVLQTGNAVALPWADKVKGIVQAWYSGGMGGEAIARVLFGEVNPSGRLPLTWPVDESQLPRPAIPGWGEPADARVQVNYDIEGSDIGYRWFARENKVPRYWFGHGLSYTSFARSGLTLKGGQTVTASVDVANTGKVAGSDVVQLYLVEKPGGPARRLLGYQKVALQPGETKRVTLNVDPRLLAEYDEKAHGWRIDAGEYRIGVGADAGAVEGVTAVRLAARRIKP
ncbi:beta-glucosidase family protein [Sphingomonas hengshuiensis]|uniref:Beta-glucosidase n=1 Tax=Sphingomonas hengshuiensis TaxID=1609977 RepID=A0A7U4LEA7_9SPHN|nr:glycoside hydrolase family 3 C-terminal domain-containing protein [Sphingomonas hengshuiensis]AJP71180.1 beta-glucosidase [Sphingomonas hengshuiensis]